MEILLGAGSRRHKFPVPGLPLDWSKGGPVTVDIDPLAKPAVLCDLMELPLPFAANAADEIHAYDVMEHLGQQGDWRWFFRQWAEFWRILKPDGVFVGVSPARASPWAWGDPGHSRIVGPENLVFLNQPQYDRQVGITPMTDYRHVFQADFDIVKAESSREGQFVYVLRAVKPSRCAKLPVGPVTSRRGTRRKRAT